MTRVGYLVPEFPGQTHSFFWREMQSLAAMGVECDVISTRLPPKKIMSSHAWSQELIARTTYLSPPAPRDLLSGALAIARSGPAGWRRILRALSDSKVGGFKSKVRLAGLAVVGARVASLARRRQWQHLHAHSCADSAHVALFAHLVGGIPYSLTLHGPLEDYGSNQSVKWSHAAFGIVITRKLLSEVRAALGESAPAEIEVAPMGVNVDDFHRDVPYRPWDGNGPFRIFSCGRLNPCKGHGDLIQAIALLRGQGVDANLEIAGADDSMGSNEPVREHLEKLIDNLNLRRHVALLGAVSEQLVRRALEKAHAFALASLNEPLGVVIMEAMAMETPVVVTRTGGVPELVEDGIDGILVQPQNPQDISRGLIRVAKDGCLARGLASAGREKVVRSFQSDQSARTLARHLQKQTAV